MLKNREVCDCGGFSMLDVDPDAAFAWVVAPLAAMVAGVNEESTPVKSLQHMESL